MNEEQPDAFEPSGFLDDHGELLPVAQAVMSATLGVEPTVDLRERLLGHAGAKNPLLTFTERAAAFLRLGIAETQEILEQAAQPSSRWSLNPTPGVFVEPVAHGTGNAAAQAFLLRLDADGQVPSHGHTDQEWGLILKGQLADDLGDLKSAGDLVYRNVEHVHRVWNPGTTPGISLNLLLGPHRHGIV